MVARTLDVRQMGVWIQGLHRGILRGAATAVLETAIKAEGLAKKRAKEVFKGTRARPKSGNLMNGIKAVFEASAKEPGFWAHVRLGALADVPAAFLGVTKNVPYARAQELGAVITPKKAKHLWIPLTGPKSGGDTGKFKTMTPGQFLESMHGKGKESDKHFWMLPAKGAGGGYVAGVTFITAHQRAAHRRIAAFGEAISKVESTTSFRMHSVPLFALKSSVKLSPKPYLMPAIEEAVAGLPALLDKRITEILQEL